MTETGRNGRPKPPTIAEVADRAEVSIATVSRVVSGRGRVLEATRRRVEQVIAETGWAANPAARQLAGGPGEEIILAVAVADRSQLASDPYFARVIAGAQEEAERHGLFLSVHVTRPGSLPGLVPLRGRHHVGAILVNAAPDEASRVSALGPPLVSMGKAGRAVPSVRPENEAGAAEAAGYLLAQGRRRIATVAGPRRNPCARERLAGYRARMRAAGRPDITAGADFTRPGAARAARRLLAAAPDLDAIFVASDLMATAVLQVLAEHGRRVPDDVAVVGFDDSPPAWMTTPVLSTVRQPVEDLAGLAVRMLTAPPGTVPPDQRLPVRLIVRASSAA